MLGGLLPPRPTFARPDRGPTNQFQADSHAPRAEAGPALARTISREFPEFAFREPVSSEPASLPKFPPLLSGDRANESDVTTFMSGGIAFRYEPAEVRT